MDAKEQNKTQLSSLSLLRFLFLFCFFFFFAEKKQVLFNFGVRVSLKRARNALPRGNRE
jgi:hypothetical protein